MEELKPCPFCGATAEVNKHYPPYGRRIKVIVRCTICRCNSGEWGRTDKAIEAWNRRANDGKQVEKDIQSNTGRS